MAALVLGLLPVALWLVLNFMRPDLLAPMLDHVFGYVATTVELLLVSGSLVAYLAAALQERAGARVGLQLVGVLLFTLPAVFLVLFGPIVFAFMYGGIDAR